MAPTIPERLECFVTQNGKPVQGLMMQAKFGTSRKNPYYIPFGPTDENGRAVLSRSEALEWADQEHRFALMDYDALESSFTGIVILHIETLEEIDAAIKAYDMFEKSHPYPRDYRKNLQEAREVLQMLSDDVPLKVSAAAGPEPVRLIVRLRRKWPYVG